MVGVLGGVALGKGSLLTVAVNHNIMLYLCHVCMDSCCDTQAI